MIKLEKYHSDLPYSYAYGAFVCIELLKNKIDFVKCVLVHSSFIKNETYKQIVELCQKNHKEIIVDDKLIEKIRNKDNIFVIGVFNKFPQKLENNNNHIVINSLNDYGIIGTILRSMNGFNFSNLVLINSDIDIYHTHLVRSSMGAIFHMHIFKYASLEEYLIDYKGHNLYYVDKKIGDKIEDKKLSEPYSILFEFSNLNYEPIYFSENINLENVVNIIIYNLYQRY